MAKTIDDLAVSIAAGFEGVDKQFKEVSQRFDGVEKRIDSLEKTVDNLEKTVGNLQKTVDNVEKTVSNLPDKAFVTDKLADVKGDIVLVVRREYKKVDFALDRLQQRGSLTKDDVAEIHDKFQVFPSLG